MLDTDTIHRPKTLRALIEVTREITKEKTYLLIESKDEKAILVNIRTATTFNVGVDLITDSQYNRLNEYFEQYGSIATIDKMANAVWNTQRGD